MIYLWIYLSIHSVHHWWLAQDLSAFPSVLRFHKSIGHPVSIVSFWVSKEINRSLLRSSVSEESSTGEAEPLHPSEGSRLPVSTHSWGCGEHGSNTDKHTEDLKGESWSSSLSLEESLLVQQILLWGNDNIVSSLVSFINILPVLCVIHIDNSLPEVGRV